jgi:hypothetical protein
MCKNIPAFIYMSVRINHQVDGIPIKTEQQLRDCIAELSLILSNTNETLTTFNVATKYYVELLADVCRHNATFHMKAMLCRKPKD